jgi:hypothetical protein
MIRSQVRAGSTFQLSFVARTALLSCKLHIIVKKENPNHSGLPFIQHATTSLKYDRTQSWHLRRCRERYCGFYYRTWVPFIVIVVGWSHAVNQHCVRSKIKNNSPWYRFIVDIPLDMRAQYAGCHQRRIAHGSCSAGILMRLIIGNE